MAITQPRSRGRGRDYPPLVLAGLVTLVLLAFLPSALNLPQTNPSQTLEYAPVPPEDEASTPPAGNFSSLGLGSSRGPGLAGPGGGGDAGPGESGTPPAVGKNPSTKRCVGNPPRQTEDPLSPPCVAFFQGDNGGATYPGVTKEEVRVLFYLDGSESNQLGSSQGSEPAVTDEYFDLGEPPKGEEQVMVRMLRHYQRYFNERYQTYNRFVRFFAYYDADGVATVEQRRADAADNYDKVKPFAAYNQAYFSNEEVYSRIMNRKRALVFTGAQNSRYGCCAPAADFEATPGLRWGTAASTEQWARVYAGAVCRQVVNRPVSFGGNSGDQGKPRVLGLIINKHPANGYPEKERIARLVETEVRRCGGQFATEWVNDTACGSAEKAAAAVADFRAKGVTTVVWPMGPSPGGVECGGLNFSNAAASARYLPEVVVQGDGTTDMVLNGQVMNQDFWRHSIIVTAYTRAEDFGLRPCAQAARSADPSAPQVDIESFACEMYDGIRLMFTGIQVAGPKLHPRTVDKGFHAIPSLASKNAYVSACFFDPGDYTCVKDAMLVHWDPAGKDPGSSGNGCYRMIEEGKRYLFDGWPDRDIAALRGADDVCNRQGFAL